jgi:hypothetical protein
MAALALAPAVAVLLLQGAPSSRAVEAQTEQFQNVETRVSGAIQMKNTAVVRLQPTRQATVGATVDRSGEFAVVDVWTKDGESWKLSARYLSRPDVVKR